MNQQKRKEPTASGRLFLAFKMIGKEKESCKGLKTRAKSVFKRYMLLIAIGIAYMVFCRTTGLSLSCPFHALTGLDCPGCGITRLFLSFAEGDLTGAFLANEALFICGPFLLAMLFFQDLHWIFYSEKKELPRSFVCFLLIVFALFTIWRNFFK